jgi:hypothetical protein
MAPRNVCAFAATLKLTIISTARNNRLILHPLLQFSEQLTSAYSVLKLTLLTTCSRHSEYFPKAAPIRPLDAPRPCSRRLKNEKLVRAKMAVVAGCYAKPI